MTPPRPAFEAKIVGSVELSHRVVRLVRPVVFTNGVFDILHRGHVTYLAQARALGASLVVAVNSDSSVRQLGKGTDRPINGEADRAAVIAALECVTLVTVFEDRIPLAPLQVVRPDIYVKGGDYDMEAIPETALVRSWGGIARAIPIEHDHSTTRFIDRIRMSTGPASTMSDGAGTS